MGRQRLDADLGKKWEQRKEGLAAGNSGKNGPRLAVACGTPSQRFAGEQLTGQRCIGDRFKPGVGVKTPEHGEMRWRQ